jgi:hypothetical protein
MPAHPIKALSRPLLLLLLGATLFVGCGGGGEESLSHIQGISATITKPMLNHWVRVVVANDFRAVIGTKAPQGLVAEPFNPGECAEASKKISPRSFTGKLKLSDSEIASKCRELYEVVRDQAMGYLISAQWEMLLAKEQHVHLSEAELHKEFLRYRKEVYGTDAKFQTYMREHRMVLSDVLYQLRRNVYTTRIVHKALPAAEKNGGGFRAYADFAIRRHNRLVSKTTCKSGYVMEDCKNFHAPAKQPPSPNAIIEGIVKGTASV